MKTPAVNRDDGLQAGPGAGARADSDASAHAWDHADFDAETDAQSAGSLTSWRNDGFWPVFLHACAPLAIWAGHFFGSYAFVAIGCRAGLDSHAVLGIPLLTLTLLAGAAAALVWLVLMLRGRSRGHNRRLRSGSQNGRWESAPGRKGRALPSGATAFRTGAALLSLVAVVWTTPPMVLLTSCLQ